MKDFSAIDPYEMSLKPIERIGKRWMLITAGELSSWNTMTASWGFMGELWSRPAVAAFVRPSRHTFGFMEKAERFTLSFFPEEQRKALQICGSVSGRDTDKARETGLRPQEIAPGEISFAQADLVLCCRKIYADDIYPERFIDTEIMREAYPRGDFHRMYIGAIESAYTRGAN